MASFWKNLIDLFSSSDEQKRQNVNVEALLPTAYRPRQSDYPNTFDPSAEDDSPGAPQIFEPALLQFARAFRHGDPHFGDAAQHQRWIETRRQVIDHLLGIIAGSKWNDHLVLRGSLLLKTWLGDAAREPGDIDWVFRPETVGIEDPAAIELYADLKRMIAENPGSGEAVIDVDKITTDDIWTYERAAGRRIIFPWQAKGLPPGSVQMDVVFKESLLTKPVQTQISLCRNSSRSLWSADREISLAWKLLWLENDIHPQGKDLYDAALLAEQTHLPLELLMRVLQSGEWHRPGEELSPDFPLRWEVDWKNFRLEYPWVEGRAEDWQARLTEALNPTFNKIE